MPASCSSAIMALLKDGAMNMGTDVILSNGSTGKANSYASSHRGRHSETQPELTCVGLH